MQDLPVQFLAAHYSSFWMSFWMAKPSSVLTDLPPQFGVICKFAESTLHPISQVKMGNAISSSIDPWETSLVTTCEKFELGSSTLWLWSDHFFIPMEKENGYSKQGLFFPWNEKVKFLISVFSWMRMFFADFYGNVVEQSYYRKRAKKDRCNVLYTTWYSILS